MATPSSTPHPLTGDNLIDAATHGYYWQLDGSRTINWSLANGFFGEFWTSPSTTVSELNTVFDNFSYYANIHFNYVGYFSTPSTAYAGGSDITISLGGSGLFGGNTSTWAIGLFPNSSYNTSIYQGAPGDVFFNINSLANFLPSYAPGSAGYALSIHEIGHTLGLKHPFDNGGTGRPTLASLGLASLDTDWFTVMAYNDDYNWNLRSWDPATLMPMDVLALQYLYGPNLQTNAANSSYALQENGLYQTIWDAGGTDVVDVSLSSVGWDIELPNYQLSSLVVTEVGGAIPLNEVSLSSPFTLYWLMGDIENVSGSAFVDSIVGNDLSNVLSGGGGDDTLRGGAGNDTIDGGAGIDVAVYTGARSGYQILRNGSQSTITDINATDGDNGSDTLTGVERAQFGDVTLDLSNRAPVATPTSANRGVHVGQLVGAASLFNVTDADNDPITQYRFWDDGTAQSSGYFSLNGARQPDSQAINVSAADLPNLNWVAGGLPGSETVWIQAGDEFGFGPWTSWTMSTSNAAPVATPTAATQGVVVGQTVAALSLFGVTDADGDAITQYRFWDGGAGGGQFRVNGVAQGANRNIEVSAADLANTIYAAGALQGSETLWVRANDGTVWSEWRSWSEQTLRATNVLPVVNAPAVKNAEQSQWLRLSDFVSVSDADGDAMVRFELRDGNASAGSAYLWANGVPQAQGADVVANTAQLSELWVRGGQNTGTDSIQIRANDGFGWGNWTSFDLLTRLPNRAPVVVPTAPMQGTLVSQLVSASALFSGSDPDGDTITYEFWDSGGAQSSGYFDYLQEDNSRVRMSANTAIPVNSLTLMFLNYRGGSVNGTETLWVRANDGALWSPWTSWSMVTRAANALPVVDAPVIRNADVNQWQRLSEFVTVADANSDAIVRFELRDLNNAAGSGYLWANGVAQAQGAQVTANASNLTDIWVRGGQNTGTDSIQIRANDGFGWGNWTSFDLLTRLPNRAPVATATAATQGVVVGQTVAALSLFGVTDADGDAITQYRFWDGGAGGGQLRVNGVTQSAQTSITVSAAELANTIYAAGALQGAETLWVQAYDGSAWSPWTSWTMATLAG